MVDRLVLGVGLFLVFAYPILVVVMHQLFMRGERRRRSGGRARPPEAANDAYPRRTVPGASSRSRN